jgi:hypothetical protein
MVLTVEVGLVQCMGGLNKRGVEESEILLSDCLFSY